jgi:hypothetical protein
VKSLSLMLIIGWRNDVEDHFTEISLFILVGQSLYPRGVGLFPAMGCMVP